MKYITDIFRFLSLPFLLFCISCSEQKPIYSSTENLYKKDNRDLNAGIICYHINDSVSSLYFSIPNENLIYKHPDTSSAFYAAIKIKFFVYPEDFPKQMCDSGSTTIFDRQASSVYSTELIGDSYLNIKSGKKFSAEVFIYDLNRKSKSSFIISIDKTNSSVRQNFLLQNKKGKILFGNSFQPGDTIIVKSYQYTKTTSRMHYFSREFPLALPPFSQYIREPFNYKPDKEILLERTGGVYTIMVPPNGFYHLITDETTQNGLTIFARNPSFPKIKDETEMIKCTRYIMSKKEYEDCLASVNKKQAIDEFWLDVAGSNERAKELIRKYYNRVEEANKLFTSHQPGWQTDRGMIYVVFGAPNSMHKYNDSETWVYGTEAQPNAIRFNFKKIINPFTPNDYLLERNDFFKEPWYNAVENWRQGHIYLDN